MVLNLHKRSLVHLYRYNCWS